MKIVVSYISSLYDYKTTIDKIEHTSADGIHVDLMDGVYAGEKNFNIDDLLDLFKDVTKPLDIHLMLENPSDYLDKILKLNPSTIYIHPSTEKALLSTLNAIEENKVKRGIAINPDEEIEKFEHYFPYIDVILLMSVKPGKGGQKFLNETPKRLEKLLEYQKENNFEIFIDGGINKDTIKLVSKANGVVSGSYICQNADFEKQIETLRIKCNL